MWRVQIIGPSGDIIMMASTPDPRFVPVAMVAMAHQLAEIVDEVQEERATEQAGEELTAEAIEFLRSL